MALKIDTKVEGKLTCTFKNDMRNFANFHQSTFSQSTFSFRRQIDHSFQQSASQYFGTLPIFSTSLILYK